MKNELEAKPKQNIIPLAKWNDYYDYPKVSSLRQIVFRNTDNFRTEVIRYIGKTQYIDVEAFFNWVSKPKKAI